MEQGLSSLREDNRLLLDRLDPPTFDELVRYLNSRGGAGAYDERIYPIPVMPSISMGTEHSGDSVLLMAVMNLMLLMHSIVMRVEPRFAEWIPKHFCVSVITKGKVD